MGSTVKLHSFFSTDLSLCNWLSQKNGVPDEKQAEAEWQQLQKQLLPVLEYLGSDGFSRWWWKQPS